MSISFEGLDSRMSQETMDQRILFEASNRAKERSDRDRIKMEDFSDLYSWPNIERDLAYVKQKEMIMEQGRATEREEGRRMGLIFEEITVDQIELNEWLGAGVTTRKASKFDDIHNGVDEVVEINEEDVTNYLALAIDVTTSTKSLDKKMTRIRKEIEAGALSTVKYFENSEGSMRGQLSKVARVVIGVDSGTVLELAKAWIERDNKTLAEHPAQLKIIEEILVQLRTFRDHAAKMNKPNIVAIYERNIRILERIKASEPKQRLYKKYGTSYFEEDKVFNAIAHAAQGISTQTQKKEVKYTPLADKMHNRWNVY